MAAMDPASQLPTSANQREVPETAPCPAPRQHLGMDETWELGIPASFRLYGKDSNMSASIWGDLTGGGGSLDLGPMHGGGGTT